MQALFYIIADINLNTLKIENEIIAFFVHQTL